MDKTPFKQHCGDRFYIDDFYIFRCKLVAFRFAQLRKSIKNQPDMSGDTEFIEKYSNFNAFQEQ